MWASAEERVAPSCAMRRRIQTIGVKRFIESRASYYVSPPAPEAWINKLLWCLSLDIRPLGQSLREKSYCFVAHAWIQAGHLTLQGTVYDALYYAAKVIWLPTRAPSKPELWAYMRRLLFFKTVIWLLALCVLTFRVYHCYTTAPPGGTNLLNRVNDFYIWPL